ncbi:predicted protein [Naegleria gruberi]|uniref:Predicted protein n=1 Tax=Naegleria gruberi TaxID=5762 RepID=D2VYD1_NAEGR|nr:uncharacterized protein NAEGRDRAFT_74077 [Naegleria gruberi]EFC38221.1 predicted protein [Naegleria gruberi]|eukprot:XP_002670965.1 predicted protein [Naegleria gruberi strain NEG-M]
MGFSVKTNETLAESSAYRNEIYPISFSETRIEESDTDYVRFQSMEYFCFTYPMKVHRSKFLFKNNKNVQLHLDRVWFSYGETYVIYSIFGDVLSSSLDNLPKFNTDNNSEFSNLKLHSHPCRSKIIQMLFNKDQGLYANLVENNFISSQKDYKTVSLLEYEAERVKLYHINYNHKTRGAEMSAAEIEQIYDEARQGRITLCTADENDESVPYYSESDDGSDDENDNYNTSSLN